MLKRNAASFDNTYESSYGMSSPAMEFNSINNHNSGNFHFFTFYLKFIAEIFRHFKSRIISFVSCVLGVDPFWFNPNLHNHNYPDVSLLSPSGFLSIKIFSYRNNLNGKRFTLFNTKKRITLTSTSPLTPYLDTRTLIILLFTYHTWTSHAHLQLFL